MLDYIRAKSGSLILISTVIALGLQSSIAQDSLTEHPQPVVFCEQFDFDWSVEYPDRPVETIYITRHIPPADLIGAPCSPIAGRADTCERVESIIRYKQPRTLWLAHRKQQLLAFDNGVSPQDLCVR